MLESEGRTFCNLAKTGVNVTDDGTYVSIDFDYIAEDKYAELLSEFESAVYLIARLNCLQNDDIVYNQ